MPTFEVTLYFESKKSYTVYAEGDEPEEDVVLQAQGDFHDDFANLLPDGWSFTDLANVAEISQEE